MSLHEESSERDVERGVSGRARARASPVSGEARRARLRWLAWGLIPCLAGPAGAQEPADESRLAPALRAALAAARDTALLPIVIEFASEAEPTPEDQQAWSLSLQRRQAAAALAPLDSLAEGAAEGRLEVRGRRVFVREG